MEPIPNAWTNSLRKSYSWRRILNLSDCAKHYGLSQNDILDIANRFQIRSFTDRQKEGTHTVYDTQDFDRVIATYRPLVKPDFKTLVKHILALPDRILPAPQLYQQEFDRLVAADVTGDAPLAKSWLDYLCYQLTELMRPILKQNIATKFGREHIDEAIAEWNSVCSQKIPSAIQINQTETMQRKLILTAFLNHYRNVLKFWKAKKRDHVFTGEIEIESLGDLPEYMIRELEDISDYCVSNDLSLEEELRQRGFLDRLSLLGGSKHDD